MTVVPERLALLESISLDEGNHESFESGHCAMEVVSWLADEGFTDAPQCASPVLRRYVIRLNDRWDFEKRQLLKPYLVRLVGTAGDGLDERRLQVAREYVAGLLVPWLRLAGLDREADQLEATPSDKVLSAAYSAAWRARNRAMDELSAKVKQRMSERAVAAADAVAAAVAVAVADAAAVAVADADAAAVAVAVADADAAAVAAAAADADAAAAADAVAVAAAAEGKDTYSAAYTAARDYYRKHPLPVSQQIAELGAQQDGAALDLLEKLIKPEVA